MKRYKLKKDLPTFHAGEEFYLDSVGNLKREKDALLAYCRSTLDLFPNILKDWFEEIPEEPKTVWNLEDTELCYTIDFNCNSNYITSTCFDEIAAIRRERGDLFITREEAEKELARRRARQILLRDTKGFKPDWKSNKYDKWEVAYKYPGSPLYRGNLYTTDCNHCSAHSGLWFASKEDAEASIKVHKKEWLTYLGVEE